MVTCPYCDGEGYWNLYTGWNHPVENWSRCPLCRGTGKVPAEEAERIIEEAKKEVEVEYEEIPDEIEF